MLPFLYDSAFLTVQTLWVFVMLAILVGAYLVVQGLKRSRLNFTLFIEHSGFLLFSAVLLARVTYFLLHLDIYTPALDVRTIANFFSIWDQGFSFWGGLVGFTLALLYRLHKSEENTWKWLDALVVPVMVGMIIGTLGAFLGGYSYGNPTSLPWGVSYELYNVKYTVPVHPVQLYVFLYFLLVLWAKRKLKSKTDFFQREGNSTLFYGTLVSLGLFVLEFFRGDDTLLIWKVRLPMIGFFLLFLCCGWLLSKRFKSHKPPTHASESI